MLRAQKQSMLACPAVSCSNYEPEGQVSILLLLLLLLLSLGWFDRGHELLRVSSGL